MARAKQISRLGRRTKIVLAGTVLAALAASAHIVSGLTERVSPQLSSMVWPGNHAAWSRAASTELAKVNNVQTILTTGQGARPGAGGPAAIRMRYYAENALAQSAVQEEALRNLAYAAVIAGDRALAERIARKAYAISRRDVGVQMLLAVRMLDRGELGGALRHMDEALRTNQGVRQQVFGALAQALRYPEFNSAFEPYVRADNEWLSEFLAFALTNKLETRTVGELIKAAGDLPVRPGRSVRELAPAYLVAEGEIKLARQIAEQLPRGIAPAEHGGLSDADFTQASVVEPFGWAFADASELSVRLPNEEGPLRVSTSLPYPGEVARQLMVLPPGRYRLSFRGDLRDNASWTMRCSSSGTELIGNLQTGALAFTVPARNCDGQWLMLVGKALGPLDLSLERVEIVRLSP